VVAQDEDHQPAAPAPPSGEPPAARTDERERPDRPVAEPQVAPTPEPRGATTPEPAPSPPPARPAPPTDRPPSAPPVPEKAKTVDDSPELVAEFGEEGAEEPAGAQVQAAAPWEGYDGMTAAEVRARLDGSDSVTLTAVILYEGLNKGRSSVTGDAERRLRRLTPSGR
jgi:hypothetical protein